MKRRKEDETVTEGFLADVLFAEILAPGFTSKAEAMAWAITHRTSPNLSDAENKRWLELQGIKYNVQPEGIYVSPAWNDYLEAQLKYFEGKASR